MATNYIRKIFCVLTSALLLAQVAPLAAQDSNQSANNEDRIQVTTELVLVNVVARDKNGNALRDLKKEDFTLYEDGKKQQISTFDFENVEQAPISTAATVSGAAQAAPGIAGTLLHSSKKAPPTLDARDRRLIVLFFDFSAMQPEDIDRSVDAAKKFVRTKMQPADLIALVSLATNMHVDLDFTDDQPKLMAGLSAYESTEGQGFDTGTTGSSEGTPETNGSFTEDDTDLNAFTADRKLLAIQSLMQVLGKLPQKKSVIYFSNGITQSYIDNQSALRSASAAAVKANTSIYSLDVRGLQAFPPGGEAQNASLHGQSAYSGASILNDLNGNAASQDTLATLSTDTGGKAFFDSNDFSGVFSQVQKDSSVYYVLGFTSNNPAKDGKFRHLRVTVNRLAVKLDFRAGYYAGRDFVHSNRAAREQQLEDELAAQLPSVDVPLYAGASYFRKDESHYYLAVSLVIPGSQIPFVTAKDKDDATIDIIGVALASAPAKAPPTGQSAKQGNNKTRVQLAVGRLRDTVKLAVESTRDVRRKNVQYNTGFVLAPGSYHLKFVVRENQTGRMGSFETDVRIPDLRKSPLKMSSVILSSQRVPATGKKTVGNPLVRQQTELVPNITHVFTPDQHLYLQYDVYDPAKGKNPEQTAAAAPQNEPKSHPAAKSAHDAIRVFSSVEFIQNSAKILESSVTTLNEMNSPERKAVTFQMDLPLQSLKPGLYLCQVNVIDDVAGSFSFPRFPILIREAVTHPFSSDAAAMK
jgi:VWFA-related protein